MSRFIKPAVVRLPISGGDSIDIKKRLNTGEHQDYLSRMMPHQVPGEKPNLETKHVLTGKVLAYLVGWSLSDDGQPVKFSLDMSEAERLAVLSNLDPDTFREIREAIEAHEESEDKVREKEKNAQAGGTSSKGISPSSNSTVSVMKKSAS